MGDQVSEIEEIDGTVEVEEKREVEINQRDSNFIHSSDDLYPRKSSGGRLVDSSLHQPPPTILAQNGAHKIDKQEKSSLRAKRKDGSGGLPLYVFLQDGSNGDSKTVDPRCSNASNPYHVCTHYCSTKMKNEIKRDDGPKSPLSFLSRRSSSSSSSGRMSSKMVVENKKVDQRCKNSSNPYHECTELCGNKLQETSRAGPALLAVQSAPNGERRKKVDSKCPNASNPYHECTEQCPSKSKLNGTNRGSTLSSHSSTSSGGSSAKVDPRCPNASNPYHECTDICFQKLPVSNHGHANPGTPRKIQGALEKAERREDVYPSCVYASNPYHHCTDSCLAKIQR